MTIDLTLRILHYNHTSLQGDQGIFDENGLQSVLITFKDKQESSSKRCEAIADALDGRTTKVYSKALNGCAIYLPEATINALDDYSGIIESVEFDSVVTASENEASTSWGLDRVNQCSLPLDNLKSPVDGTGVKVYILDTGIRGTHNDFDGLIDSNSDCHSDQTDEGNALIDGNGHG